MQPPKIKCRRAINIHSFVHAAAPKFVELEAVANTCTMSRRYTGEDALAYQEGPQDAAGPVNYIQKRLQKRKGVEVVFDPKGQKYAHCAAQA